MSSKRFGGAAFCLCLLSSLVRYNWAATEKLLQPDLVLRGHTDGIMSLGFSPDGKVLASASHDNTVRTWNPDTGKSIHTYEGHTAAAYGVSFSPDGKWLATCSTDKTIKVWDVT